MKHKKNKSKNSKDFRNLPKAFNPSCYISNHSNQHFVHPELFLLVHFMDIWFRPSSDDGREQPLSSQTSSHVSAENWVMKQIRIIVHMWRSILRKVLNLTMLAVVVFLQTNRTMTYLTIWINQIMDGIVMSLLSAKIPLTIASAAKFGDIRGAISSTWSKRSPSSFLVLMNPGKTVDNFITRSWFSTQSSS